MAPPPLLRRKAPVEAHEPVGDGKFCKSNILSYDNSYAGAFGVDHPHVGRYHWHAEEGDFQLWVNYEHIKRGQTGRQGMTFEKHKQPFINPGWSLRFKHWRDKEVPPCLGWTIMHPASRVGIEAELIRES